jgi:hypothetical protein
MPKPELTDSVGVALDKLGLEVSLDLAGMLAARDRLLEEGCLLQSLDVEKFFVWDMQVDVLRRLFTELRYFGNEQSTVQQWSTANSCLSDMRRLRSNYRRKGRLIGLVAALNGLWEKSKTGNHRVTYYLYVCRNTARQLLRAVESLNW